MKEKLRIYSASNRSHCLDLCKGKQKYATIPCSRHVLKESYILRTAAADIP